MTFPSFTAAHMQLVQLLEDLIFDQEACALALCSCLCCNCCCRRARIIWQPCHARPITHG